MDELYEKFQIQNALELLMLTIKVIFQYTHKLLLF